MNPELRLLMGSLTDDEYRRWLVTGRLPVARPGWSDRWRHFVHGLVALGVLVFVLGAILSACVVFSAAINGLPGR